MLRNALIRDDVFYSAALAPSPIIAAMPAPRGRTINPHVTRFFLQDGRSADLFHVKPVYYETREGFWRPLSEITAHHGNRRIVLKPEAMNRSSLRFLQWLMKRQALIPGGILEFGYPGSMYWGAQPRDLYSALTLTAFPDPDPETVTVDGFVQNRGSSWNTTREASSGFNANDSGTTFTVRAQFNNAAPSACNISRGFVLFDTSAMGDFDTVTAATLSLNPFGLAIDLADGNEYIALVTASPATNTALITSDFNDIGSQELGDTPLMSAWTEDTYNVITLNSSGLDALSKTGISKFALREGHDFENDQIDNGNNNSATFRSAETTGTASDPKLIVTYTAFVPGPVSGAMFF